MTKRQVQYGVFGVVLLVILLGSLSLFGPRTDAGIYARTFLPPLVLACFVIAGITGQMERTNDAAEANGRELQTLHSKADTIAHQTNGVMAATIRSAIADVLLEQNGAPVIPSKAPVHPDPAVPKD